LSRSACRVTAPEAAKESTAARGRSGFSTAACVVVGNESDEDGDEVTAVEEGLDGKANERMPAVAIAEGEKAAGEGAAAAAVTFASEMTRLPRRDTARDTARDGARDGAAVGVADGTEDTGTDEPAAAAAAEEECARPRRSSSYTPRSCGGKSR
jgi:hypothetical protein